MSTYWLFSRFYDLILQCLSANGVCSVASNCRSPLDHMMTTEPTLSIDKDCEVWLKALENASRPCVKIRWFTDRNDGQNYIKT